MVKIKDPQEIRILVKSDQYDRKRIFSIIAHIDHGKSTTADFLLKRAGLMREEDAGHLQMTDTDEEEQARGITIFTSVILLSFDDPREKKGENPYIFQINDTPGHLSFTGEVSRALRSSDGCIVLVDALEGMMTQTETNIRLAVGEEWCKPVLFINKVDRLISELRLEPKEVYERVDKIINEANDIIREIQPDISKIGESWEVSFSKNSVALGSAKDGWCFTLEILGEKGIKPNKVFEKYNEGDMEWLRKNLPLDESLLRMIVDHLPDPVTASKYRLKKLVANMDWESDLGKSLLNSDPNGPLMGIVSKIFIDPKSFRATLIGRVYSGTMKAGETIYLVNRKEKQRIKRLGIMELTDILDMNEVPAGNLFALFGFICPAGESFVGLDLVPDKRAENPEPIPSFESIKYACEAVVSRSIAPVEPQDLAKLGEVVRKWLMADNTAKFHMDRESKEYILSGIDPLQIEILTKRINQQIKIKIGEPIIVYREMIDRDGAVFYTKSSNGHNRILMNLSRLDDDTAKLISTGDITADQNTRARATILRDKADWDAKQARGIWDIYEGNILLNSTRGLQIDRIKSYTIGAFRDWVANSILAGEPAMGILAEFTDCTMHVDPAHTGYNEIASMIYSNLALGFMSADPKLYEPIQKVDIKVPTGLSGSIVKILSQHRGKISEIRPEGAFERVIGKLPVAETMGIADEFRGATKGRAFFGYEFDKFQAVPSNLQEQLILAIRKRKGMKEEMPNANSFERFIYKRK